MENPSNLKEVVKVVYLKVEDLEKQIKDIKQVMLTMRAKVETQREEQPVLTREVRMNQAEMAELAERVKVLETGMQQLKLHPQAGEDDQNNSCMDVSEAPLEKMGASQLAKPPAVPVQKPDAITKALSPAEVLQLEVGRPDSVLGCGTVESMRENGVWQWTVSPRGRWMDLTDVTRCGGEVYSCPLILPLTLNSVEVRLRFARDLDSANPLLAISVYPVLSAYNRSLVEPGGVLPLRFCMTLSLSWARSGITVVLPSTKRSGIFVFDQLGRGPTVAAIRMVNLPSQSQHDPAPQLRVECKPAQGKAPRRRKRKPLKI